MKISMIGMGKLGIPVALAWESKGHDVVGYDIFPTAKEVFATRKFPYQEEDAQRLLEQSKIRVVDTVDEAVAHGDLCFIAVQTPHGEKYEGVTRMPTARSDFDYAALKASIYNVAVSAKAQKRHTTIVVISTALPGTCEREVLPLLNEYTGFCYAPMFIAMSQVISDALNPEFVLLGIDKSSARSIELVRAFFESMHAPEKLRFMSVVSAELTKVAYNVALSVKITIANSLMEIAHKTGANVDDVTNALGAATDRIISKKYLRGGMPDAGPCHPRDIIALAWLAQELHLSYDFFGSMVYSREAQAAFIAEVCAKKVNETQLPIVMLGVAYKKGVNLTVGSAALLLKNILLERGFTALRIIDPYINDEKPVEQAVYVVSTDHDEFFTDTFLASIPKGSTIIDPWGKVKDVEGCQVVRIGRA